MYIPVGERQIDPEKKPKKSKVYVPVAQRADFQSITPIDSSVETAVNRVIDLSPKETKIQKFERVGGDIAEEIPLGLASAFTSLPSGAISGIDTIKRNLLEKPKNNAATKIFKKLFPEQTQVIGDVKQKVSDSKIFQSIDDMFTQARSKADILKQQGKGGIQAYREGRDITGEVVRKPDELSIAEKGVNALATTVGYMIPAFLAAPATGATGASTIGAFLEAGSESADVYDQLIEQGASIKEAEKASDIQFTVSGIVNFLSDRFGIFGESSSFLKRIIASEITEVPAETLTQLSNNLLTGKKWDTGLVETAITTAAIVPFLGAIGSQLSNEQMISLKKAVEKKLQDNEEFKILPPEQQQKIITTLTESQTEEMTPESISEIANLLRQEQEGVILDEEEDTEFEEPVFKEKDTDKSIIEEAKKYKSAEEFVKALKKEVSEKFGIENPSQKSVEDWFIAKQQGMIGGPQKELVEATLNGEKTGWKTFSNAPKELIDRHFGDNSTDIVTVYRGVNPKETKFINRKLYNGDFVTGKKQYAQQYGKVSEYKINKKDLIYAPDGKEILVANGVNPIQKPIPLSQLEEIWKKANEPKKPTLPVYKGEKDLTTKILKDLEGRTTVSKQYILDATNRPELKQVERDLIRQLVETEGDTINVADFAKKVKAELLPLERVPSYTGYQNIPEGERTIGRPRYENVSLPTELKGDVKNYTENVYESPIKTSAGNVHFGGEPNYFGHTRIEDMADNKTRRVIEVQSDLYQKGNLEKEIPELSEFESNAVKAKTIYGELGEKYKQRGLEKLERAKEVAKLQQYNDPTAHFRMIREEIKKAAQDGKTKLQFPTGETAMKIEGLGARTAFHETFMNGRRAVDPDTLKIGQEVFQAGQDDAWIITEVLGDGKFKAVPKDSGDFQVRGDKVVQAGYDEDGNEFDDVVDEYLKETFDISGKLDTNNPIYKFYEKDVAKYLNKFGGKRVVDDNGVSWTEIPITKEMAKAPVMAFKEDKETKEILISQEEATKQLQEFLTRLKINIPYQFVESIITPNNKRAFGAFFDNTITFEKFITDKTVLHEIGHAIFRNIEDIALFYGITRRQLYVEGRKKYGKDLTNYEIEERMMEDLETFSRELGQKKKTITGRIRLFLSRVYSGLKGLFGKRDQIKKFYTTILEGKAKETTDIISQNDIAQFKENNIVDFRKAEDKIKGIAFKRSKQTFTEDKDPLVFLADIAESFEEGTIARQALDEWTKNLTQGMLQLELYQPGGQLIPTTDGGFKRQQATFLTELPAEDRPSSAVDHALEAFSRGVKPKTKKALYIYNHIIEKAFNNLNEEFQYEIGSLANLFETRPLAEIKKEIEAIEKSQKSLTPAQTRKSVAKILYKGLADKKYTLSEKKLFAEKVKNLNKGFRLGEKKGRELQLEKDLIKIEELKRSYQLKNLKDNIVRRSYVTKAEKAVKDNIPTDERGEYLSQLARIGKTASLAEYNGLLERVYARKEQLDIEKGETRDKAKKRQKIGYLRKINNLSPKLVKDARKILAIENTIPKMTIEELNSLLREIGNRIVYLQVNNLIPQPGVKELTKEDIRKIASEKPTSIKLNVFKKEFLQKMKDVGTAIGQRIKRISPEIFYSMETMVFNTNKYLQDKAKPVLEKLVTITKELQKNNMDVDFKIAILSKRYDLAEEILKDNGIDTSVLIDLKNIFDDIFNKLKSVGVDVDYLEEFFPRYLTKEGAIQLENNRNKNLTNSIDKKRSDIARDLTQEEIANVWSSYFRGFDFGSRILLSDGRFGESREIEILSSRELVDLYQNIPDSFSAYINQAIQLYESRKFFNKFDKNFIDTVKNGDFESGITHFVESIGAKNNYTGAEIKELQDMIQTFFSIVPQSSITKGMTQFAYTTGLGQILSFVPQALEAGVNTALNLEKELTNPFVKLGIKPSDIYLDIRFDAFEDGFSAFSEIVTTPMRKGDLFGALVAINQLYDIVRIQAKENNQELRNKVEYIYGKEKVDEVMKTLASSPTKDVKEMSPEMSRVLFTEMGERRVISRLDKSKVFIKNPLWGVFKSYTVKMLTKIVNDGNSLVQEGIRTKNKAMVARGIRKKGVLIAALMLSGATQQLIKDLLRGNDVEDFPDYVLNSFLNIFGLNRYGLDNLSRNGIANTVYQTIAPAPVAIPLSIIETIKRDISKGDTKTFERLPIAGDIIKIIKNE